MTKENSTQEEWISRCAQRYVDVARLTSEAAREWAEACWENREDDSDSPEEAADIDMSYWEE